LPAAAVCVLILGARRFSPFAKKAQGGGAQKMGPPLALMIFADIMAHTHYKFLSLALAAQPLRETLLLLGLEWKSPGI